MLFVLFVLQISVSFVYIVGFILFCRHNIRDIFEIYSKETNPDTIDDLISMGERNIKTFQVLSKLDKETWDSLCDDRKNF